MSVDIELGPPTTLTRRLVSVLPILVGLAILFGGDGRFRSPAFAVPRTFAPWWVWGAGFVFVGAFMVVRSWTRPQRIFWPAAAASFLFGIWEIGLILSAFYGIGHNTGAFTGIAVYGWLTVALAATAARDPHPLLTPRARQRVQRAGRH